MLDKEESEGIGGKEFKHRKGCEMNQFYIPVESNNCSPNFFRDSAERSNKTIKILP